MRLPTIAVLAALFMAAVGIGSAQQGPPLALSQLAWFDRAGKPLGTIGPLADHGNIELSPDNQHVASAVVDRSIGTRDIWTYPVGPGAATRLTSLPGDENWMIWTADGLRTIVNAFSRETLELFEIPAGGGAHRSLTMDHEARWPVSISPDGRYLLFVANGARTSNDIWVLPLIAGEAAYPFRSTAASENWATFSPDGRFVAYSSTEDGAPEVYVTPFPGPGPSWRVSDGIGTQARWRQQDELIYIDGTRQLIAVSLRVTPSLVQATRTDTLFTIDYPYGSYHAFDVTRDGRRVLVNSVVVSARAPGAVVERLPAAPGQSL